MIQPPVPHPLFDPSAPYPKVATLRELYSSHQKSIQLTIDRRGLEFVARIVGTGFEACGFTEKEAVDAVLGRLASDVLSKSS